MAKAIDEEKRLGEAISHSERRQIVSEFESLSRAWANVGSQTTRSLIEIKMAKLLGQL